MGIVHRLERHAALHHPRCNVCCRQHERFFSLLTITQAFFGSKHKFNVVVRQNIIYQHYCFTQKLCKIEGQKQDYKQICFGRGSSLAFILGAAWNILLKYFQMISSIKLGDRGGAWSLYLHQQIKPASSRLLSTSPSLLFSSSPSLLQSELAKLRKKTGYSLSICKKVW